MIPVLLATLCLAVDEPTASLAHLHPQDCDLFFEVPDMAAFLASYEGVPLTRLIGDEGLRASAATLWEAFSEPIGQGLQQAAGQIGKSPQELLAVPGQAIEWLHDLSALSASVSGIRSGIDRYATALSQWGEAWDEADRLQGVLEDWLSSGGERSDVPSTVEGLPGVDLELTLDPWGSAYRIVGDPPRVISDGPADDPTLSRTAWAWADGARRAELREGLKPLLLERLGASFLLSFNSAETARGLSEQLLTLAASSGLDFQVRPFEFGDQAVDLREAAIEIDGTPVGTLWMASGDELVALGFGASTPAALAGRMADSSAKSLASDAAFGDVKASLDERLQREGGGTGVLGLRWFERDALANTFLRLAATEDEQSKHFLGFLGDPASPNSSMSVVRLVAERFHEDRWTRKGAPSFFDGITGVEPVDTTRLELVPEDAIFAFVGSTDWQALYSKLITVLGEQAPPALESYRAYLKQIEETYGLDLEGQLISSLGENVVVYLQPLSIGTPNFGLILELREPDVFREAVQALAPLISEQSSGTFEFDSRPYKKVPVWTLRRTSEPLSASRLLAQAGPQLDQALRSPFAPSPSIVVFDDSALLGLTAIHTKRMVKRVLDDENVKHPLLEETAPSGAQSLSYVDWAGIWTNFYAMGRSGMALAGGNLPFDVSSLPTPEELTKYFEPTITWSHRSDEGTWKHKVSSFGPEVIVVPLLVSGLTAAAGMPAMAAQRGAASGVVPVTGLAISAALDSYAIRNAGAYPSTLEELEQSQHWRDVSGDASVHAGMLDAWGRPFRYEVDGMNVRLWSMGPNGFDEDGAGDDVVIRRARQERD